MKKIPLFFAVFSLAFTLNTFANIPEFSDPAIWTKTWVTQEQGESPSGFSIYATLATTASIGTPTTRLIQLFETKEHGWTFFTHKNAKKVRHITHNPQVSINFWLPKTRKQINIEGKVHALPKSYLAQKWQQMPRWMQLNFIGSDHKSPLAEDKILENKITALEAKFPEIIPMPDTFVGYYLEPLHYTFFEVRVPNIAKKSIAKKEHASWAIQRMQP